MLSISTLVLRGFLLYGAVQAVNSPQQPLPQSSDMLPRLSPDFLGNSPLRYCNESRPTDLFWLDRIDIEPEQLYMYLQSLQYTLSPPTNDSTTVTMCSPSDSAVSIPFHVFVPFSPLPKLALSDLFHYHTLSFSSIPNLPSRLPMNTLARPNTNHVPSSKCLPVTNLITPSRLLHIAHPREQYLDLHSPQHQVHRVRNLDAAILSLDYEYRSARPGSSAGLSTQAGLGGGDNGGVGVGDVCYACKLSISLSRG